MDRRPRTETCCSYERPSTERRAHDLHAWSYGFLRGCYYRWWMWACQTTSRTISKGSASTQSDKGSHFHLWGLPSLEEQFFFSMNVQWWNLTHLDCFALLGFCIGDQSRSGSRDACRRYSYEKSRALIDASKACPRRKGLRRSEIVGSFGRTR